MSFKASMICAALSLTAGLACGSAHADGPSASPTTVKQFTGALGAVAEGRRTFIKLNCAGCHGDRGAGSIGPNIRQAEQGNVNDAVTNGAEGMPAYGSYLNTTDLANLGAYLRSIGSATEPRFVRWWDPKPLN